MYPLSFVFFRSLQPARLSFSKLSRVYLILILVVTNCTLEEGVQEVDVLVLGPGTGGTAAAIQAARSGANTMLVNPLPWHGGMLTAAGVSATDGNHRMPAGLWGEFRRAIYAHYGGAEAVATGWVSNTHFEPHVGAAIFDSLLQATQSLEAYKQTTWTNIEATKDGWRVRILLPEGERTILARQLIDGTDLGDVAASVGADFDLGMDSREKTGEEIAPAQSNDIVQDLTYVAILKDYGAGNAPLLPKPPGYDPAQYNCVCDQVCEDPEAIDCELMLNYARLPGNKYMINWPNNGNDYYVNAVPLSPEDRAEAYEEAKLETLRFVYFLQQELGFTHLGLADDEFPTQDHLALYPYHREGRRVHGLVQMRLPHVLEPYRTPQALYRTGIAVGDYPIDHHHGKYPDAPEFDFPPVPSFSVPAGALISKDVPNLLVADKAISVSNIVNGSTRLQPVILQIGQAAGLMAAMAAAKNLSPGQLSVRDIQEQFLAVGGYLQPYYDVPPEDPDFQVLHRIGATGLLMGTGEPYQWANRTWLYPDSLLLQEDLLSAFRQMGIKLAKLSDESTVEPEEAIQYLQWAAVALDIDEAWTQSVDHPLLTAWQEQQQGPISRRSWARLLDQTLRPFQRFPVDFEGRYTWERQ